MEKRFLGITALSEYLGIKGGEKNVARQKDSLYTGYLQMTQFKKGKLYQLSIY